MNIAGRWRGYNLSKGVAACGSPAKTQLPASEESTLFVTGSVGEGALICCVLGLPVFSLQAHKKINKKIQNEIRICSRFYKIT
jgi:hypothetical protein